MSDEKLVNGQWPPKGYEFLDCGHVVRPKTYPIIHVGEMTACSETCAHRLEKNPPKDAMEMLLAMMERPEKGEWK